MIRKNGFTLVELLIVIVVIAVLATISIVAYNGIQERARMASALAYAAQIKRSPDAVDATASYSFDDCTVGMTTVQDSSAQLNTGTVSGNADCSTDTPSGTGKSFVFNGTTRIDTAAQISSTFYIKAAWVKFTSCSTSGNVISSSNNTGSVLYNCAIKGGHNGTWGQVNPGINLNDGKWHYLVQKYENGILSLTVDGQKTVTSTTQVPASLSNQIGAFNNAAYFTGLMDDVLIIAR